MRLLAAALSVLLTAGCVRSSVQMLDERTAIISAHGSAFDNMGDVTRAVLVEAATEAHKRGFRHFVTVSSQGGYAHSTVEMPGYSQTNGSVSLAGITEGAQTSATGSYDTSTLYVPPTSTDIEKPRQEVVVRFLKEDEMTQGVPNVWDADSILAAQKPS